MTVYVDDMYKLPMGQYRGMKMSHMLADSTEELLAMADTIGVQRRWIQYAGTDGEHFDIALSKRKLAVENGAVEITIWDAAEFRRARREGDPCITCNGEPCPECGRSNGEYDPDVWSGCTFCDDAPCEDCTPSANPKVPATEETT